MVGGIHHWAFVFLFSLLLNIAADPVDKIPLRNSLPALLYSTTALEQGYEEEEVEVE